MDRSPLYETHKAAGVSFVTASGWEIPAAFTSLEQELQAARAGVALVDRSQVGRLLARGNDTLDLLTRLSTNQLDGLAPGQGVSTVLTTGKGRIIDWLTALHHNEAVLLLTSPERRTAVAEWIDLYTFEEDTTLADITLQTAMIGVLGPGAPRVVEHALAVEVPDIPLYGSRIVEWQGHKLLLARTDPAGRAAGFDLVVPAAGAVALWETLRETDSPLGATPIGETAFEALRVDAGIPRWGWELSDVRNPLEAGLEGAISWDKGCYTGQEVIARLHTYHKVQRYLVGLALENSADVARGASLIAEGKTVGTVSSVGRSLETGKPVAMGYLRTPFVQAGATVGVDIGDGSVETATIVRTPDLPKDPVPAALLDMLEEDDETVEDEP